MAVIPKLDLVRGQHGLLWGDKTLQSSCRELLAEDPVHVLIGEVLQSNDLGPDLLGGEEQVGLHEPLHLELDLLSDLPVHCAGAGSFLARCESRD